MTNQVSYRIYSLDLLRGLVMVVMALDHTRDFFHFDVNLHDPLDLATTTPGLYFTRWITHYCAPIFVFLAGTSIYLQGLRKSGKELSSFLLKRGLWLILIEVFVMTFAWTFDWTFPVIALGVIWAIGVGMVLMSLLIRLPFRSILVLGFLIVLGHNILDSIPSTHSGFTWDLLRNGNFAVHNLVGNLQVLLVYPVIPWLGLLMLGYGLGSLYKPEFNSEKRKKILAYTGIGLIIFFVVLRFINVYGDPFPWFQQGSILKTIMSFINVHKYPPSLLYILITIGPALIFLSLFENVNNGISRIISVYGRVPFFYYVLHFYLLHLLCMILYLTRGHSFADSTAGLLDHPFRFIVVGEGYSLTVVYIIWIAVVIALYPLCYWFGELKKRNKSWWLSYL